LKSPARAWLPVGEKQTEVIISGVVAHAATWDSGIDHTRSRLSKQPLKKSKSFLGWKSTEVTKSACGKQCRHSEVDTCHSRTCQR
jgi:hypothetical protein